MGAALALGVLPVRLRCAGAVIAARLPVAEHLHLVGANFGAVLFNAALVGPFARAQADFNVDLRALAQVPG